MNMDAILDYTRDPNEDFYQVLGCNRLSTTEQIQTEFKIRAKECHPDKQKNITESNPERFQLLLKVRHKFLCLKVPPKYTVDIRRRKIRWWTLTSVSITIRGSTLG